MNFIDIKYLAEAKMVGLAATPPGAEAVDARRLDLLMHGQE
jgi:hypothetical protein